MAASNDWIQEAADRLSFELGAARARFIAMRLASIPDSSGNESLRLTLVALLDALDARVQRPSLG